MMEISKEEYKKLLTDSIKLEILKAYVEREKYINKEDIAGILGIEKVGEES